MYESNKNIELNSKTILHLILNPYNIYRSTQIPAKCAYTWSHLHHSRQLDADLQWRSAYQQNINLIHSQISKCYTHAHLSRRTGVASNTRPNKHQ